MSAPPHQFVGASTVCGDEQLCAYRSECLAPPLRLVIRRRCSATSRKTWIHAGCGPMPKAFRHEIR
jgi:hypothetical protein